MKLITIDGTPVCTANENKSNADIFKEVQAGLNPSESQIAVSMEFMRIRVNGKNKIVKIISLPHLD